MNTGGQLSPLTAWIEKQLSAVATDGDDDKEAIRLGTILDYLKGVKKEDLYLWRRDCPGIPSLGNVMKNVHPEKSSKLKVNALKLLIWLVLTTPRVVSMRAPMFVLACVVE